MKIAGTAVLVSGANRGLGRALVEEALRRGARRVYAGTRRPFAHPDARVTRVALDVTDDAQIEAALDKVNALDILINNAGVALYDDLTDRTVLERHFAVNVFGTHALTQAFLPRLARSHGAIVNILSDTALAPFPIVPAYSVSKAAAFSMTQSQRLLLAELGVRVHAVLPGPIDTDMSRHADIPKSPPDCVARGILDGVERGEEDIFPDPMSAMLADIWRSGAGKLLARRHAALAAQSVTPLTLDSIAGQSLVYSWEA